MDDFDGLDCTIFETGSVKPDRMSYSSFYKHVQYRPLVDKHMAANKPVFLTEAGSNGGDENYILLTSVELLLANPISIAGYAAGNFTGLGTLLYLIYDFGNSTILGLLERDYTKSRLKKIYNFFTEVCTFYFLDRLRDSITAKKAEEFVVPMMKKRLGRKPNIGIVFGASHSGMELSLRHKKLRDWTLKFHSVLGYPGIDTDYLNKIYELDRNEYEVELFDV